MDSERLEYELTWDVLNVLEAGGVEATEVLIEYARALAAGCVDIYETFRWVEVDADDQTD